MRRALMLAIVALWALCTTTSHEAKAEDNDFRLHRISTCGGTTTPGPTGGCQAAPDVDGFKGLTRALGGVFAPSVMAPAETLGEAGFSIGLQTKISIMPDGSYTHEESGEERNFWRALNVNRDSASPATPTLTTLEMHMRKGFPFSFELDTLFVWLLESEMFWIGGGIKWTILEDVHLFAPDIAVHGHGGTVVGSPDMSLTTAGVDISISKSFGIAGVVSLTPYAGANLVFIIASSRVIDADPTFSATPSAGYSPEFVFAQEEFFVPRGFGGLRFGVSLFSATLEFASDGLVHNIGANLSADF